MRFRYLIFLILIFSLGLSNYGILETINASNINITAYVLSQCSDSLDNDSDSLSDYPLDPGCSSSYDEREGDNLPVCSDGHDNDSDGRVDYPRDIGCVNANDTDEADLPVCSDGHDNDSDGKTDYPDDPGCSGTGDENEVDPTPETSPTSTTNSTSSISGGGGIPSVIARLIRQFFKEEFKQDEVVSEENEDKRSQVLPPDLNKDGVVNIIDFSIILHVYGRLVVNNTELEKYDLNKDGVVDISDVSIILFYWR